MEKPTKRVRVESQSIDNVLDKLQSVQLKLEELDDEAAHKIVEIESEYNEKRRPWYSQREMVIESIPSFWRTCFLKNPDFESLLTPMDAEVLKHLISLNVDDFDDVKSGYRVELTFSPNEWFKDKTLWKDFHFSDTGLTITSSGIDFFPGKDYTREPPPSDEESGQKRKLHKISFFTWFVEEDVGSHEDIAGVLLSHFDTDHKSELLKEEIWSNPLRSYGDGVLTPEQEIPRAYIEDADLMGIFE